LFSDVLLVSNIRQAWLPTPRQPEHIGVSSSSSHKSMKSVFSDVPYGWQRQAAAALPPTPQQPAGISVSSSRMNQT
jgi:hypothetical protein